MGVFFVTQITKTAGSDVYAIATTVKEDAVEAVALKAAKALYHQILASVYATADIKHAIVKIDNFYGNTILMETIIPAPEPEPEEEEES